MLGVADVVDEDFECLGLDGFPDVMKHGEVEYSLYYHAKQGERDDGVTLGVHVDQLPKLPEWLPGWGVDGNLRERAEILLRSLPKDYRRICQPIGPVAEGFAALWSFAPKDRPIFLALSCPLRMYTHLAMWHQVQNNKINVVRTGQALGNLYSAHRRAELSGIWKSRFISLTLQVGPHKYPVERKQGAPELVISRSCAIGVARQGV